jgi:hypothetical protein
MEGGEKVSRSPVPRLNTNTAAGSSAWLPGTGKNSAAARVDFLTYLLKVNPLINLRAGLVQPAGRTRSRAGAVDQLYAFAAGYSRIEELAVEHTGPGLLLVGILGDKAKAQSAG